MEIPGYTEFQHIASGGNADVYQARPLGSHGLVAVKVVRSAGAPDVLRRFERERHLTLALSDVPNVVEVYQSGFTKVGEPYIVMPMFARGSLDKQLQSEGPIHWTRAVDMLQLLTRAVAAAHERRILHLDIKPANVLIDAGGIPHLADFGIAELVGRTHSMSGALLTPAYSRQSG